MLPLRVLQWSRPVCQIDLLVVVRNLVCLMCVVHVYSVDDEAFLQQMNVVSQEFETPSQEYETNYDEENLDGYYEGFLDEPRGRTANYTAEEDKLIVLAWKKVGLDPAVGTEQPKDTYWRRMKEFFDARNNTGNVRTVISIRHRWGTISTDCQKWSACLTHVDRSLVLPFLLLFLLS